MHRAPPNRAFLAALMAVAVLLAGCVGKSDPTVDDDQGADDDANGPRGDEDGADNGTADDRTGDPSGDGNDTAPPANETDPDPTGNETGDPSNDTTVEPEPEWPDLGAATVRPGVQHYMTIDGTRYVCTTNFVYHTADLSELYLGTAAHCVDGLAYGDDIDVYGTDGRLAFVGSLAYSSWIDIGFEPGDPAVGDDLHPHDFALIGVPEAHRGKVHPATLHYGGPTAVGDLSKVTLGTRVMAYGNSALRPGVDVSNWQEGFAYGAPQEETKDGNKGTTIRTLMPAVPGDSGSGLMTKSGHALGAASAISPGPPYSVRYSSIPDALAHLEARGWDIELATWGLLSTLV